MMHQKPTIANALPVSRKLWLSNAIEQKVAGGWDAFFRHIELGICCGEVLFDDYLVAIHRRSVGLEAVKEFASLGLLLWEWDWDNFKTIDWIDGCLDPQSLRTGKNPSWCDYALGERSRDALRAFVATGAVMIHRQGVDRYGRTLATVSVNGRDAGEYLISLGLARVWVK